MATKRKTTTGTTRKSESRAWARSLRAATGKSFRQNVKATVRRHEGRVSTAEAKAFMRKAGKAQRKAYIAKGVNPNTGKGSYSAFALKRAAKTGLITAERARRVTKKFNTPGNVSASYAREVLKPGVSPARYGKRIAKAQRAIALRRKAG